MASVHHHSLKEIGLPSKGVLKHHLRDVNKIFSISTFHIDLRRFGERESGAETEEAQR